MSIMDFGRANATKATFNKNVEFSVELHENKEGIEEKFGEPLEWNRLDELKTSYFKYRISSSGLSDMKRWDELQDKLLDAMIRLERAFKSEIQNL